MSLSLLPGRQRRLDSVGLKIKLHMGLQLSYFLKEKTGKYFQGRKIPFILKKACFICRQVTSVSHLVVRSRKLLEDGSQCSFGLKREQVLSKLASI